MSNVNTHYQGQVADLLAQIKAHQHRADLVRSDVAPLENHSFQGPQKVDKGNFDDFVAGALREVNETQHASMALKNAYERGEDIPLTDVVLAMQKASIGFEATMQVRNKLLRAYEDIKNMPV
jgi:flagellar hook-basal body complex protein FliE